MVHDMRRVTYQQTRKCSEVMLLLGQVSAGFLCVYVTTPPSVPMPLPPSLVQTDRAVQLLLETDSASPDYYTDALK